MVPNSPPPSQSSKKTHKRKRTLHDPQLDRLDSLPWNSSLPHDDSFSLLLGSRELEGGFLSLEEIDEDDYGLVIPKPEKEKLQKSSKSKKQKQSESNDDSGDKIEVTTEEKVEEEKNVKDKKKKKKKKKKKAKNDPKNEESAAG